MSTKYVSGLKDNLVLIEVKGKCRLLFIRIFKSALMHLVIQVCLYIVMYIDDDIFKPGAHYFTVQPCARCNKYATYSKGPPLFARAFARES